jgi:hypothetical protein
MAVPARPWFPTPGLGTVAPLLPSGLLLLLLAGAAPAQAGSVTSQSVWGKSNAIDRAMQQVPAGATVTGTSCDEVNVGIGNYHYTCTVEFTEAPANPGGAASPAPAPAPGQP